jgi:hypothetical protein
MKKSIFATIGLIALCSCNQNYEVHKNYEFSINKKQLNTIEDGHIIYYDSKPFGSLDGLGMIATGGRGMGYAGMFISDTNNAFFKNATKHYERIVFPVISCEIDTAIIKK